MPKVYGVHLCLSTKAPTVDKVIQTCYNTHIDTKEHMMIKVAKMTDGKVVEVVRVADTVGFSHERGWVMVCFDFEKISR